MRDVGTRTTVRSGEFIVGNFVAYIQTWDGTLENSKLAYSPLYPPDYTPGHAGDIPLPTITAQRLDTDSGPIMPVQGINPAWAGNGCSSMARARCFPSGGDGDSPPSLDKTVDASMSRFRSGAHHGTKLDTARSNVTACWSQSAVGAAATITALEVRPATRQAISRYLALEVE